MSDQTPEVITTVVPWTDIFGLLKKGEIRITGEEKVFVTNDQLAEEQRQTEVDAKITSAVEAAVQNAIQTTTKNVEASFREAVAAIVTDLDSRLASVSANAIEKHNKGGDKVTAGRKMIADGTKEMDEASKTLSYVGMIAGK